MIMKGLRKSIKDYRKKKIKNLKTPIKKKVYVL